MAVALCSFCTRNHIVGQPCPPPQGHYGLDVFLGAPAAPAPRPSNGLALLDDLVALIAERDAATATVGALDARISALRAVIIERSL